MANRNDDGVPDEAPPTTEEILASTFASGARVDASRCKCEITQLHVRFYIDNQVCATFDNTKEISAYQIGAAWLKGFNAGKAQAGTDNKAQVDDVRVISEAFESLTGVECHVVIGTHAVKIFDSEGEVMLLHLPKQLADLDGVRAAAHGWIQGHRIGITEGRFAVQSEIKKALGL